MDNVIIRRADGTVVESYRDGKAPDQKQRAAAGYSNVSLSAVSLADVKAR